MDIKPYDKTIREILLSRRQFVIPRFQREYSWEKKNYKEFLEDMINCISILDGKVSYNPYFLGTMLFIGNYAEGNEQEIEVVDGQQRLTTITILFSAISDRFIDIGENVLSEQIFQYIMTKDDNGNDVRILKSKTHYPFFSYYIQDRNKTNEQDPDTEEEVCIKETYEYLYKQLDEKILKNMLKKKHGSDMVDNLKYVDILKVIRDQVLNSTFVSISTKNKDQAYNIFEILNAKGKRLAHIDLIKNKLFEVLKQTEPVDFAEDYWNKTKKVLNSGKESVGIATFYRHFWISKYKKSTSNKMYDDFVIVRKDVESYKNFMIDMYNNAENYIKIINPTREDYENRKEYYWLVQSLNVLNNYFNIVQVRIALLALYDLKKRKIIELKDLKRAVIYLENFHFAYNAIISGRSNRFESIYSKFAIKLSKCTKRTEARECIEESLIKELDRIYPSYKDFKDKFIELAYSKKNIKGNVKTKYALNKLNAYYSGKEIFEDDSSIEHIISETRGIQTLNIGNLILLESKLNEEADNLCYEDKIKIYKKSQYAWVNQFIMEHDSWEESDFLNRAEHLAKVYYQKILNRNI